MNDVYIIESWLGEVQQLWSTGIQLLMRGFDGAWMWWAGVQGIGVQARRGAACQLLPGPLGPA